MDISHVHNRTDIASLTRAPCKSEQVEEIPSSRAGNSEHVDEIPTNRACSSTHLIDEIPYNRSCNSTHLVDEIADAHQHVFAGPERTLVKEAAQLIQTPWVRYHCHTR